MLKRPYKKSSNDSEAVAQRDIQILHLLKEIISICLIVEIKSNIGWTRKN